MELKQQVTSLEISKHLKELGVKQKSLFVWLQEYNRGSIGDTMPFSLWYKAEITALEKYPNERKVSAFTVAELGEMLPWAIEGKLLIVSKCSDGSWVVYYEDNIIGGIINKELCIEDQGSDTEADALGKMLIYLLENKLISP